MAPGSYIHQRCNGSDPQAQHIETHNARTRDSHKLVATPKTLVLAVRVSTLTESSQLENGLSTPAKHSLGASSLRLSPLKRDCL